MVVSSQKFIFKYEKNVQTFRIKPAKTGKLHFYDQTRIVFGFFGVILKKNPSF